MSNDIVTLSFNAQGKNPIEIDAQWSYIAWRFNATGVGKMFMPYTDSKCTDDILGIGNRILVRFANGLPMFGGVIDDPRRRLANGVECTVYTGHRILKWRNTPKLVTYTSLASGTIAKQVLLQENSESDTGIAIGAIYEGGTERNEDYKYDNVRTLLQQLQGLSGEDYGISPVYSEQQSTLTFRLDWYERLGMDKTATVALVEGKNIAGSPALDEQGPIAGKITLVEGPASGTDWSDRLVSIETDVDSLNNFGYREFVQVLTDVHDQSTLDANAVTIIADVKDVKTKYTISVIDDDPSGYAAYTVGDSVALTAWTKYPLWALDNESVRIIGREWRPDNVCRLEAV